MEGLQEATAKNEQIFSHKTDKKESLVQAVKSLQPIHKGVDKKETVIHRETNIKMKF